MPRVLETYRNPWSPVASWRSTTRPASREEVRTAATLLEELQANRNAIALVPAPRQSFPSQCIRVQTQSNATWYRRFLAGRWDRRGCQVKRSRVIKALQRVALRGQVRANGYEVRLLEFAKSLDC